MTNLLKNIIIIVALCFSFTACVDNENISYNAKSTRVLRVNIESPKSRSVILSDGTYHWLEEDRIGVYGTKTKNAEFSFNAINNDEAIFKGNLNTVEEELLYAYYPFSDNIVANENYMSFDLPSNRQIDNNNLSPMYGTIINGHIYFTQLGGTLFIRFDGLPEKAKTLIIQASGENVPFLSGQAIVNFTSENENIYQINEGSNFIKYNLENIQNSKFINGIYIPLQVGFYPHINFKIVDNTGQTLEEKSISNVEVKRAHLIETPILNFTNKWMFYQLTDDLLYDTFKLNKNEWTDGYYTNDDVFILCNESDSIKLYMIANTFYLNDDGTPKNVILASYNKSNQITDLYINEKLYKYSNHNGNKCDKTVYNLDGTIETYTNVQLELTETRTIGSTDGRYEAAENVYNTLNNEDVAANVRGWSINSFQLGMKLETTTLAGIVFARARNALLRVQSTAIMAFAKIVFSGCINNVLGNAKIITDKPIIENGKLNVNAAIINDERILDQGRNNHVEYGILTYNIPYNKNAPNNDILYDMSVKSVQEFGYNQRPIKAVIDCEIGYTYYVRSYMRLIPYPIVVEYGNTRVFSPEATIELDNSFPEMNFKNGSFAFNIEVTGNTDNVRGSSNMILNITGYDKYTQIKKWDKDNNQQSFECQLPIKAIDFKDMETPIIKIHNTPTNSIKDAYEVEYCWPKYNKAPSLSVTNVAIQPVSRSTSRTLYDDNDDKTYEDNITVTIASEGTGLFEKIWCTYSKGGTWAADAAPTDDGQIFRCSGSTNRYSKKNGPGTVTVKAKLRNGTEQTVTTISFVGIPISSYRLN